MRRKVLIIIAEIAVLFFGSLAFGQDKNQGAPVPVAPAQTAPGQRYTLKATDVLGLTFRYTPDFNHDTTVQADGFVQLKGLPNGVHIQGLTVQEAQREIIKAYATILKDPDVTVTLKDFEKPYFVVSGSVKNPGKFDYRDHTTVMQAVAMAGGFDNSAKHSQILLMRRSTNDLVQVTMVDLRQVMKGKELAKDTEVRPGDTIFAPKSAFSKFAPFIPTSSLGMYQHY
jgi:polysaccharide export outer membrane protein